MFTGQMKRRFSPMRDLDQIANNATHRTLFSLPPIRKNTNTIPGTQVLPPWQVVTGDTDIDMLLWLHSVIATGQPDSIATAKKAAKKMRIPVDVLEERSGEFNCEETPAELFCAKMLHRVKGGSRSILNYDRQAAAKRFKAKPDLMPNTLADCLHELNYWNELYLLRKACGECGESRPVATIRDWFVFTMMAEIKPRSREEALAVYQYMIDHDMEDQSDSQAIIRNLIG